MNLPSPNDLNAEAIEQHFYKILREKVIDAFENDKEFSKQRFDQGPEIIDIWSKALLDGRYDDHTVLFFASSLGIIHTMLESLEIDKESERDDIYDYDE